MKNKFKGKRLDNNEWIYGDIIHCTPKRIMICPQNQYHEDGDFKGEYIGKEVDPATVGQYINKNDDNDNEIFKGDICKITSCLDEVYIGEVVWNEASLCWAVDIGEDLYCFYEINDCEHGIEVIGNIHDKPELLEV